jgi:RimJ/RimL family protein N-acetyltransferase
VEDWEELSPVAADPLIWEQHPEQDRYKPEVFRRFFHGAMQSGGAFAVLDADSGEIIGSTRYAALDEGKREIEIGWTFLARRYWGGIYNREMKELLLRHAFRFVESVVFRVGANNRRSQRAVEKIGGLYEGVQLDDCGRKNVLFRLTRQRWQELNSGENMSVTAAA